MHHSRPIAIPLEITDINIWSKTFDRDKLDEDLEVGVRGFYQDHGFFRVIVHDPILNTVDENRRKAFPFPALATSTESAPTSPSKSKRATAITWATSTSSAQIPIKASSSNPNSSKRSFRSIRATFFQQTSSAKPSTTIKSSTASTATSISLPNRISISTKTPKSSICTLRFDQQKQFFVRRIEFTGNTTTRDKVIRREILLDEGNLFNNRLWEVSLLRLNQLGYFEVLKPENAEIKRNQKAGTVDINLKVHEKGKQSISLSGGVSGLAGSFIGLSYQTNNFLGLGETLTFSAQIGDRQRNLVFGFTEPYLFDRPISTGFTVFSQKFDYNQQRETSILLGQQVTINPAIEQNYNTDSKGFTLFASYPLRRFSFTRVGLTYGYTTTNITAFSQSSQLLFQSLQFQSLAGPSALRGIESSKITPTINYSTVNNPQNATKGKSFFYGLGFEGGPLGGNTNTITNTFTTSYYHPINKNRNVLALRFLTAFGTGYGGKVEPPQNRFYLGGENDIRGFDFFTISPYVFIPENITQTVAFLNPTKLNSNGSPTLESLSVPVLDYVATRPGGDAQAVGNFEYRIPIAGPVTLALFTDIGMNGIVRRSQLALAPQRSISCSSNIPTRIFRIRRFRRNCPSPAERTSIREPPRESKSWCSCPSSMRLSASTTRIIR